MIIDRGFQLAGLLSIARDHDSNPPKDSHQEPDQPRCISPFAQPRSKLHRKRNIDLGIPITIRSAGDLADLRCYFREWQRKGIKDICAWDRKGLGFRSADGPGGWEVRGCSLAHLGVH